MFRFASSFSVLSHRFCLLILFFVLASFGATRESYAGYWQATNSITGAVVARAEGDDPSVGVLVAKAKYGYLFPSGPRPICTTNAHFASCSAHSDSIYCTSTFSGRTPCLGTSVHFCYTNEAKTAGGGCKIVEDLKCKASIGHPIEIDSGQVIEDVTDWSSGGTYKLQLKRYYGSMTYTMAVPNYSRFGNAWRSNFDSLAIYSHPNSLASPGLTHRIDITLPNTKEVSFKYNGTKWQSVVAKIDTTYTANVAWINSTDIDLQIVSVSPNVVLQLPSGERYVYDISGHLIQIQEIGGYTQYLSYTGDVNTLVTDSLGRTIEFEYYNDFAQQNKLKSASFPDGKKIQFNYENRIVTLPPGLSSLPDPGFHNSVGLSEVIYPDLTPATASDNPRVIYQYSTDYRYPYALTAMLDERGIIYQTWTYDAFGRATSNSQINGSMSVALNYDDLNNRVTTTNQLGKQTVYQFALTTTGERRITNVNGIASSNCVASNTTYMFDLNGFRNQSTDGEGRVTTYSRNGRGLSLQTSEAVGTPQLRTTNYFWDAVRPAPTQIAAPGLTTNLTYDVAGNVSLLSQLDTTTTTLPYPTTGQTRTTSFAYTSFTAAAPPAVAPTAAVLNDVALAIVNPAAELGDSTGWTVVNAISPLGVQTPGVLDSNNRVHPCTVSKCFGGTGQTTFTLPQTPMIAYQDIAVPAANFVEVDAQKRAVKLNWNQINNSDQSSIRLLFLNSTGAVISTITPELAPATTWQARTKSAPLPVGTRTIRLQILVPSFNTWFTGSWYIDDIALTLIGDGSAAVNPFLAVVNPEGIGSIAGWTSATAGISIASTGQCLTFSCFVDTADPSDQLSQDIAIPTDRFPEIDNNARRVEVQWLDQTSGTASVTSVQIDYLDAANLILTSASKSSIVSSTSGKWIKRIFGADIPPLARKIRLSAKFDHTAGSPITGDYAYMTGFTVALVGRLPAPPAINLLTSVDGPLAGTGDKVTYVYDTRGNISQITDEVGLITKVLAVDAAGRPTSIQDENGINTSLAYTARGWLTTVTVNPGTTPYVTTLTYDAAGDVTSLTLPDGAAFTYTWDAARRMTSVSNTSGERIDYTYDPMGNVQSSVTKSSVLVITKQMTMAYDELGRVLQQVGAATQTTTLSYDRTDNLTQVKDPRNNLYGYAYDGLQRLVRTTDQEAAQVNVTRDGQDEIVGYQDPRSITTSYVRNGFGEVIQEVSPDAGTTTYVRDSRGLVTQVTDGRGVVSNMTYDNAGRLLTVAYPAAAAENVTYSYDSIVSSNKGKGRLTKIVDGSGSTSFVYNLLGQVTSKVTVIGAKTYTTGFVYTKTGKLTKITYPSGRVVDVTFNTNRQVLGLTTKQTATAAAANVATALTYQPMSDLLKSITHGNGLVTTAGYDLDYRLTGLNVKNGTTVVQGSTYAYGDGINLTGITDTVAAANSNTLSYSPANRLASASGAWGSAAYAYDPVGNRLSDVVTGSVNSNRQATMDSFSNRLMNMTENGAALRSYTYDGAGNIITDVRPGETYAYTYNKRNRLASVTRNGVAYATYTYNALEQLTSRTTSAAGGPVGTIHYVYDLDGHLIVEADAATGATLREYIWLPANDNRMTTAGGRMGESLGLDALAANDNNPIDLPLAIVDTVNTTPTLLMVHSDHLGRPTRLTDATKATVWQATYKPWGEVQSISGTRANNLRFPGQYFQIETNLAYNWHRHYDPATGRYTQPDPLGFVDGPSIYAYAGSSPVILTDRSGQTLSEILRGLMPKSEPQQCTIDPGNCTPNQQANFQSIVNQICSLPSKCTAGMGQREIATKAATNMKCIQARDEINKKCYSGGDWGHKLAIQEKMRALEKCMSWLHKP
jgi:RHS repeat-associated protein